MRPVLVHTCDRPGHMPQEASLLIDGALERSHIRKVAILLRVVNPVPDDELVGALEPTIGEPLLQLLCLLRVPALGLVEERGDPHRPCAALQQMLTDSDEGGSCVHDVLDKDDVAATDGLPKIGVWVIL